MKETILFFILSTMLAIGSAQAQAIADPSTKTEIRQRARIAEGRADGSLTRHEKKQLKRQQRHIRRMKKKAAADGTITPGEKQKITKAQRRANRNIYRKKHNNRIQ